MCGNNCISLTILVCILAESSYETWNLLVQYECVLEVARSNDLEVSGLSLRVCSRDCTCSLTGCTLC